MDYFDQLLLESANKVSLKNLPEKLKIWSEKHGQSWRSWKIADSQLIGDGNGHEDRGSVMCYT